MCTRLGVILLILFVFSSTATAVDFTLNDTNGKSHRLSDYKGKWVVVNYWATWCPPCLDELPELVEFHEKYGKDTAVVLGVNYEQIDRDYLRQFIDEYFISYPVLLANPASVNAFGRIMGLPTTFVVSPEGKVVAQRTGGVTMDYLEGVLRKRGTALRAQID